MFITLLMRGSGSTMFASMLMLNRHFHMQLFYWRFSGLNNVFCVYTEVIAQDDRVIPLNKTTPYFQPLPMSKVDQSLSRIHEVPPLQ